MLMDSGIQKIRILDLCSNKCNWILLTAIAVSILMISCSPRSVRNGKTRSVRHPAMEQVATNQPTGIPGDIDGKEILEAQQELTNVLSINSINKSDTFYLDEKTGEVLPYNSHLRAIIEEQDNINRKVSSLQSDVTDIKNTLDMLKTELLAMNGKIGRASCRERV